MVGLACLTGVVGCTNAVSPSVEVTSKASASISSTASAASTVSGSASAAPAPLWSGVAAPPEALAAYDAMWEDIMTAALTADYRNPQLAAHMMGQPLTAWSQALADEQGKGLVGKGRLVWKARVTSVTPPAAPSRVEVADCLDDTQWLKYKADGSLADDVPGGRRRSASAITLQADGKWEVSEQITGAEGTC
jgi:hypothetical protein